MVECPEGCGDYDNLIVHWKATHDKPFPDGVSKQSEEMRRKNSQARSGQPLPDDHPFNQTGDDHPGYRHGERVGERAGKVQARKRDDYSCQDCGVHQSDVEQQLDVHHINDPDDHSLDNLVTLCRSCHKKRHAIEVNTN